MRTQRVSAVASALLVAATFAAADAFATPGEAIAGIDVSVVAKSGAVVTVATNEFGLAQFPDLKAGTYRVRVAAHRIRPARASVPATPTSKAARVEIFVTT